MGLELHEFTLILVFSIAVSEGDFSVMDRADAIIGERHTVGVAAEVVEDMVGRTERFFGVDDPRFLPQGFEQDA